MPQRPEKPVPPAASQNPLENLGGTIASLHLRQNVDKAGALEAAFKNGDRLALSQAVEATQVVVKEATSIENRFNQAIQGIIADLGYLPELRVSTLLTEGVSEQALESPSQHFLVESATPQVGVELTSEAEIIPQTAFDFSAEQQSIAPTEPFILVNSSRISPAETITTIELPALTELPDSEPAAPTENIDIPSVSPVSEVFVDSPKVAKTEVEIDQPAKPKVFEEIEQSEDAGMATLEVEELNALAGEEVVPTVTFSETEIVEATEILTTIAEADQQPLSGTDSDSSPEEERPELAASEVHASTDQVKAPTETLSKPSEATLAVAESIDEVDVPTPPQFNEFFNSKIQQPGIMQKIFDILWSSGSEFVTKEQILEAVWPEEFGKVSIDVLSSRFSVSFANMRRILTTKGYTVTNHSVGKNPAKYTLTRPAEEESPVFTVKSSDGEKVEVNQTEQSSTMTYVTTPEQIFQGLLESADAVQIDASGIASEGEAAVATLLNTVETSASMPTPASQLETGTVLEPARPSASSLPIRGELAFVQPEAKSKEPLTPPSIIDFLQLAKGLNHLTPSQVEKLRSHQLDARRILGKTAELTAFINTQDKGVSESNKTDVGIMHDEWKRKMMDTATKMTDPNQKAQFLASYFGNPDMQRFIFTLAGIVKKPEDMEKLLEVLYPKKK